MRSEDAVSEAQSGTVSANSRTDRVTKGSAGLDMFVGNVIVVRMIASPFRVITPARQERDCDHHRRNDAVNTTYPKR